MEDVYFGTVNDREVRITITMDDDMASRPRLWHMEGGMCMVVGRSCSRATATITDVMRRTISDFAT